MRQKIIMKFIIFAMNAGTDLVKKAFAAAAKAQHLENSYFYDKFQVEKEYFKRCHEMAIMCVLTEMADVSQKAFLDYVFDNYKSGRYDQ